MARPVDFRRGVAMGTRTEGVARTVLGIGMQHEGVARTVSGINAVTMTAPVSAMSVVPPIREDRIITQLPQCFRKEAALHTKENFNYKVMTACQERRTGTVGLKSSKVIVVDDMAVGKSCLINRFCKDTFHKNSKATINVDFEMALFEVLGVPFSLQLWDTAGQERFKCIASSFYRGAQVVIITFDLSDTASLDYVRHCLEDALREIDSPAVQCFLVGTKKDRTSPDQYAQIEQDALKIAAEIKAEYWAVSSLTGENVKEFFFRVASLAFETKVLAALEESGLKQTGGVVKIAQSASRKESGCCS